ncbi:hypothetical protein FPQ18DRAFT_337569 [Pyronema domesticum]|nr:hypothetical protein FPQ18DRAFT_337569 [Pyronema domesticum]
MPDMADDITVYKATYSGTPVYEFIANGIACMRRRSDSWINATQILKVADFDKPQRTRILEREVQRGVHEKVQGGYGKYQGTWVPLDRARAIAEQYNVDTLLSPIFNFRPSTESPPLAPKHITAASTKPRPARGGGGGARAAPRNPTKKLKKPTPPAIIAPPPPPAPASMGSYDDDDEDQDIMSDMDLEHDAGSMGSSSCSEGDLSDNDMMDHPSQHSTGMSLKRKRSQMDMDHMASHRRISYSDELLDYFMTKEMDVPSFLLSPPQDFDVDEVIDTEGHTAIHWAAAMGDLKVIELLCKARSNIYALNSRGETPLMRAVLFTNNFDRRSFPRLVETLRDTIFVADKFNSTVFHHIAATTSSRNKMLAARYYNDVLLQKLSEIQPIDEIANFLDVRDMNGDTALIISARNMARKCVRTLLGYNASPDIPNHMGETADHLIIAAEGQNKLHAQHLRASSSSPFQQHHDNVHPYLQQPDAIAYAQSAYIPAPHTSEAGINATKKVIPQMTEMLEGLANAFDKELQDKEDDHSQAQTLLESSSREIEAYNKKSEEIIQQHGTVEEMNSQIEDLQQEFNSLAAELRNALEKRQCHELAQHIQHEESQVEILPQTEEPDDQELMARLVAAREIVQAQQQRKELMDAIVKASSRSGTSDKMADYRRLIALSCSLNPEDVEELLPEILKDLEAGGDGNGRDMEC